MVKIRPSSIVSVSQSLEFYIYPIKTPARNLVQVPLSLKVMRPCRGGSGANHRCILY